MDMNDIQDCRECISRIQEILDSGIFEKTNKRNTFQQSAFIELMICMRDLLYKAEKYGKRIDFKDDIMVNDYVKDITDAVKAIRDACCHINAFQRNYDDHNNRGSFNVMYCKCKPVKLGSFEMYSDYNDDVAYYYGNIRLYLNRHIKRAFQEAKEFIGPMLNSNNGSNRIQDGT